MPSVSGLLRLSAFVPKLPCLLLTSACPSRHLSMSVAQGTHQMSRSIAHPPSRLCLSDLRRRVPYKFRALMRGHLTPPSRLVSASCSSGQRFAFGFLQICSRSRKPCRSADSAPCRASRELSPPSKCALPDAPKKKRGSWSRAKSTPKEEGGGDKRRSWVSPNFNFNLTGLN